MPFICEWYMNKTTKSPYNRINYYKGIYELFKYMCQVFCYETLTKDKVLNVIVLNHDILIQYAWVIQNENVKLQINDLRGQ